jgi:uncharacterized protein (TIGR01777 family)
VKVFVTGATGLVGSHLVQALLARGDTVFALSRKPIDPARFGPRCEAVTGDPTVAGTWLERILESDADEHLAGENVAAHRWSDAFMKHIRDSRVRSTALISKALAGSPRKADSQPKVWLAASAIGYYGPRGDEPLAEDAAPGNDFMAKVCVDWEQAADPAAAAGVRVAHPRIGVVLDAAEGALPRIALPFRLFAGGPIASGQQWVSWIHIVDLASLLVFALDTPSFAGPFNATAPAPVRNREFSRTLARVLRRPYWLPTPKFALRLAIGRMAEIVAAGQRVVPRMALDAGFRFKFEDLRLALEDLLAPRG